MFDYDAPAELFMAKRKGGSRQPLGYRRFATYNIIGGVAWVLSMTLSGYYLGRAVPNIESNIHYVVAVVIALSLLPPAIAWLRARLGTARPPAAPPSAGDVA